MKITEGEILAASILIVDDQKPNVMLLTQLLTEAGYTSVSSTMDPTQVSPLHEQNHYDLILLDLQMPHMDGFQVMQNLKEKNQDDYIPVIVITAQPSLKLQALRAGAKDFVSKPFDLVEIKTRIRNMLEVRLLYKKLDNYKNELEETVAARTQELRESEARFRSLTELASDWYWEQDEAGKFIRVSGPVLQMLGIQAEAGTDSGFGTSSDAQSSGWNEQERKKLKEIIAARQPFLDFSFSRTQDDGTVQYYRVSGEPMFDRTNQFIGYRGIGIQCKDISGTADANNA
ncbi:MAG TPA: response regulator [Cellvibrionaceae bacterium]